MSRSDAAGPLARWRAVGGARYNCPVSRRALATAAVLLLAWVPAWADEVATGAETGVGGEHLECRPPKARPGEHRMFFKVPHAHSRTEAHARVQYMLDYWKRRYGVKSAWDGDHAVLQGRIMGVQFKGWLEVKDDEIGGEATDPGFLWRGMAHKYVEGKLKKYMHPNYDEP